MTKIPKLILLILISFILISCSNITGNEEKQKVGKNLTANKAARKPKDEKKNYNEMGKIMILMYHKFSENKTDDWTRSLVDFKNDLEVLYKKGYRPISLKDYIDGKIDIPEGYTPVVFTFDDGTSSQFNLIEENGKLIVNPKTAVGVMMEFNKNYPDFRIKGSFFINHTGFFYGKGSNQQRLRYLLDNGFEIGNHTVNHVNLNKLSTAQKVQKEVGEHVKITQSIIPGYVEDVLSLPFGITSNRYGKYLITGEYEGVKYRNKALLLVGSQPARSPADLGLDLFRLPRVKASGKKPALQDMYYWIDYFDKHPEERFLSDGNPKAFSVPKALKDKVLTNAGLNVNYY